MTDMERIGSVIFAGWNILVAAGAIVATWMAPLGMWLQAGLTFLAGASLVLWVTMAYYIWTREP